MDIEIIKVLANLPLDFVLIYIIVQQQKQITALMDRMQSNDREYASNLFRLVCIRTDVDPGKIGIEKN